MSGVSSEKTQGQNLNSFDFSRVFRISIWISIIAVFVISILDLVGWILNITLLESIMPNGGTMKIITALCLISSATALAIIQFNLPVILSKILPRVLAAFICLTALITIYVFLYNIKTGRESFLTRIPYLTYFIAPLSKMAFLTACNFLFVGCILFLLPTNKKRNSAIVHALVIPVILVNYFIITSYLLGVYTATELDKISVSLNTGIAFCGISIAILLMRPDTWLSIIFTSTNTGNIIARKLIPGLMILPVVIGWLRINGERADLFRSEEGVVLVLITYTICFLVLVWFTARSVNLIDQKRRANEEALQETAQRLKYHYENSPLAVVEWRNDFLITQWSLEAERIFGWKKEEVIGKRIDNLNIIYEEDISIVENVIERLSDGKEIKVISSNRNYTKNGDLIECIWYNTLMKDEKGQISSIMSLVQDVTVLRRTEKELEDSKERYKELVTNARSIIVKLDTNGRFTFANEFAQSFFGYTEEELLGKSVMETIVPQTESTGRNLRELVNDIFEDPDNFSININENIKKSKERVWIEWYNKALFDSNGNRTGHIAIGVDITERKKNEDKLKESEAQLKELNATKDKFFNIIAHDLKNPFTSLLGSSELLYNNIHQMTAENIKKLTLILNDSAKGGFAILQNLLDWSRSQTGLLKFNPERINLKKLIDENISNLQLPAANKEIHLFSETEENIYIIADKNMINTLLRNLLNNAVKFTHRNGSVMVGAVIDSENVIISVKDTGIGISEEKIEKLFRIDTKHSMPGTENEQGTGLGLKLCKEFAEKMGGKIWVESTENKGSEFKFSIPVKES